MNLSALIAMLPVTLIPAAYDAAWLEEFRQRRAEQGDCVCEGDCEFADGGKDRLVVQVMERSG